MRRLSKIEVRTTGGAGTSTGSKDSADRIDGWVVGVYVDFSASAPATIDLLIEEATKAAKQTVLSALNANTDRWYYPRTAAHLNTDGTSMVGQSLPVVVNDQLKVTISQANDDQYHTVWVLWDDLISS